ncbi:cytochrome b5 domain-containing protein 1 [Orussus abietinus]|uniref:cytochrome b5 domain-containing protein 1 n=1 Tax=Orussus abietinus TaxID=222816 RepID=UPI000C715D56|nr:cytochrome b5 domain-containing protein 1 [Orussus abietinus]
MHPEESRGPCPCKLPFLLPDEVAVRNDSADCWVSFLGGVYDLTELCRTWRGHESIKPILAHAGKDISHWFDHRRKDIRHYVHPITGPLDRCPWWLDERFRIGNLTRNARPCRIVNVLTGLQAVITVCEEDTVERIRERFLGFNAHGMSYTWKFQGKEIDPRCTLTENGIPDERDRFSACGLPDDVYIPSLMCYYNDDLTEM